MSTRNEQERERLKQEYKEHYQRIKEAKERLKQTEKTSKIQQALNNMNADSILDSVDEFLGKVQDKVIGAEARLDVAMDNLNEDDDLEETKPMSKAEKLEVEEQLRKQRAQEALKQMKLEMGMLYSEIEKQADEIRAHKTIGNNNSDESAADEDNSTEEA